MCATCGCGISSERSSETISVLRPLLEANAKRARHNRSHFDRHSLLAINLMSSPGSGKTALLEASVDALQSEFKIAVIVGDLETENDAQRLRAKGIPAIQIVTSTACHLDAAMVHAGLHQLSLDDIDILFIEDVGNLVCPASFDLGQHYNVVMLSVTEGDDKPSKYPVMFRAADLTLICKTDLLPHLDDFDPRRARAALRRVGNHRPVISLSSRNGEGMDAWLAWLRLECLRRHKDSTTRSEDNL